MKNNVWTKFPRSDALKKGGKIFKTRRIDINRGYLENLIIRYQCVGKEFNTGDAEELFARTPPFQALRVLLRGVATTCNARNNTVLIFSFA